MKALELKIPPVAQFLAIALGMWVIAKYTPSLLIDIPARGALVILFMCLGAFFAIPAVSAFRSAHTTIDPRRPEKASRLIVKGVYRFSRNPMYLGLLCLLIAWALYLSSVLGFAGAPLFVLSMNQLQIRREEQAMAAQFGEDYRVYRKSVRRWI